MIDLLQSQPLVTHVQLHMKVQAQPDPSASYSVESAPSHLTEHSYGSLWNSMEKRSR